MIDACNLADRPELVQQDMLNLQAFLDDLRHNNHPAKNESLDRLRLSDADFDNMQAAVDTAVRWLA
jgi:hypothetical protein